MKGRKKQTSFSEFVVGFHNFILPILILCCHLPFIISYGFTLKGLINFIIILYCVLIFSCFLIVVSEKESEIEQIKKKTKEDRKK